MKIRFIRPLPQIDRVILPGQILDAPEGFALKMVRQGRAEYAGTAGEKTEETVRAETPDAAGGGEEEKEAHGEGGDRRRTRGRRS